MDEGTSASIPCPVCNVISRRSDYEEHLIKLVQNRIHLTDQRATDQSSVANLSEADVNSDESDVNSNGADVNSNEVGVNSNEYDVN